MNDMLTRLLGIAQTHKPSASETRHSELLDVLDARDASREKLCAVRAELGEVELRIQSHEREAREVSNAIRGYQMSPDHHRANIVRATSERDELLSQIKALTTERDALLARRADLAAEPTIEVRADVVQAHQKAIDSLMGQIDELGRSQAETTKKLLSIADPPDPAAELLRDRGDLLAAIQLGEIGPEALGKLDAKIQSAELEAAPALEHARRQRNDLESALAGIARRHEAVSAELERLQRYTPALMGGFLLGEISVASERFERDLEKVRGHLGRVRALRQLAGRFVVGLPGMPPADLATDTPAYVQAEVSRLAAAGIAM